MTMIVCGFTLLVTASVGCTAASSKNECLAFLVRWDNVMMLSIVWVYGDVDNADIYMHGYCMCHNQKYDYSIILSASKNRYNGIQHQDWLYFKNWNALWNRLNVHIWRQHTVLIKLSLWCWLESVVCHSSNDNGHKFNGSVHTDWLSCRWYFWLWQRTLCLTSWSTWNYVLMRRNV